jgi:hypothetical protein
MATEPVQVLDNLVRGIILAGYDFIRLSVAGFILPVVGTTRRFWPAVLLVNKRLSSLTYLALWIVLVLSIGLGTSRKMVSGIAGFEKTPDVTVPGAIAITLVVAMIIDVLVRAGLMFTGSRVRREIYQQLLRIALANILLGASILMLIRGASWFLPPGFSLVGSIKMGESGLLVLYAEPFLCIFAVSVAVIVLKAYSVRSLWQRIFVGLALVLLAPTVLVYTFVLVLMGASYAKIDFLPKPDDPVVILQRFTECRFERDRIQIASFLRLEGTTSLPISARTLAVRYVSDDQRVYAGRVIENQANVLLSSSTYTRVELTAAYEPNSAKDPPGKTVECSLKFVEDPTGPLKPDTIDRVDQ